ncbi:MAG: peptidase S9 [Bacteroidetes bacterium GWF2_42_66]|nr:MAG: peptidase S9 [Bacteroidetes bacterium GWA2_42_15]OFY01251.1 MAG: peptidase S9 [Bacteroidetes bacterium GWE2_42_39]OFY42094.1 MAG: peptidase S9 [Bacteroidetes bacterium GWF2_42_66]HBL77703.1 S9 family peptidase [Prolixibacteraceae bacterium]HCB62832.1 S9 family peptidase [Bacteroidales bacterium]
MKHILSLVLLTFLALGSASAQKQIELEDLFTKGTFFEKTEEGLHSMNDGLHYTTLEKDSRIIKYNYQTGKQVTVLFDLKKVENAAIRSFSKYQFSNDETKLLLTTDIQPIYRRSFTAEYYVWNSVTEELTCVSEKGRQQVATFSPDGERVAFVRDNNIFIKNLKFGTESQVTRDGKKNEIINGIPDWVYEEEFSMNQAFKWSPDSKMLAFIRFDETEVPEFEMTIFNGLEQGKAGNKPYPENQTFKYPKAGEKNSLVSVHVFDLKSKTTIKVDAGEENNMYIPRLLWTPDGTELAVMRLNRHQSKLDVLMANPYTGDSRLFFTEKNKNYISEDFLDDFIFLPDNTYFVINSEHNGYSHLYLYNRQGFEVRQLTDGKFDVTDFYGYDEKMKLFYYQAAKESPLRREIYYVSLDGKKAGKLSAQEGTNKAIFSVGFKYFINYFTNISTPNQVSLYDSKGKLVRVLEDNKELQETLKAYQLQTKDFFSFKTSENIELNGWMIKPAGFDATKKYPVLLTQYSGPESQKVTDEWSVDWNNYLAQKGYLVVCVDPRGTAARGEDFRKAIYMQLGKCESDDHIETAKYLGSLPYVDKTKIGIWGWSYGGFISALTLAKGGDLFKAGISVAPVTNFRFYDSVYTERYMRTPQENPGGYDDNSIFAVASGIKGRLLLVHGSADDNVHVQNTMELAEAMVQAGVQFDMAIYTDQKHGIRSGNATMHLYNRFMQFLENNLK